MDAFSFRFRTRSFYNFSYSVAAYGTTTNIYVCMRVGMWTYVFCMCLYVHFVRLWFMHLCNLIIITTNSIVLFCYFIIIFINCIGIKFPSKENLLSKSKNFKSQRNHKWNSVALKNPNSISCSNQSNFVNYTHAHIYIRMHTHTHCTILNSLVDKITNYSYCWLWLFYHAMFILPVLFMCYIYCKWVNKLIGYF